MSARDVVGPRVRQMRVLAAYNRWMNERLYALCAELTDAERRLDRGAFFRSVHGTLNHLLLGDRLWMGRFTATPVSPLPLDAELFASFGELRSGREATDAAITAWVDSLDDAELDATLRYRSIVNPRDIALPMWFALTHFFNHQTHHRGQLTTLLSQGGVDPGVTDLIWLPDALS